VDRTERNKELSFAVEKKGRDFFAFMKSNPCRYSARNSKA
jgi:hypothetical protein